MGSSLQCRSLAWALLAHGLVALWFLGMFDATQDDSIDLPPPALAVALLPPAPAVPATPPPPPRQSPPLPPAAESLPAESTGVADAANTQGQAPTPTSADMPRDGDILMEAYLGAYELGADPLGKGRLRLSYPAADRYQIELSAQAQRWLRVLYRGEVVVKTAGRIGELGLVPERYEQGLSDKAPTVSTFDWASGLAVLKEGEAPVPLPQGMQDRLSIAFQLGLQAEADPNFLMPGRRLTVPMAGRGRILPLTFNITDPEDLVLPGGILVSAIRIESDPLQTARSGVVKLWLDPADRHLPVRIQLSEAGGRTIDFLSIRNDFWGGTEAGSPNASLTPPKLQ